MAAYEAHPNHGTDQKSNVPVKSTNKTCEAMNKKTNVDDMTTDNETTMTIPLKVLTKSDMLADDVENGNYTKNSFVDTRPTNEPINSRAHTPKSNANSANGECSEYDAVASDMVRFRNESYNNITSALLQSSVANASDGASNTIATYLAPSSSTFMCLEHIEAAEQCDCSFAVNADKLVIDENPVFVHEVSFVILSLSLSLARDGRECVSTFRVLLDVCFSLLIAIFNITKKKTVENNIDLTENGRV